MTRFLKTAVGTAMWKWTPETARALFQKLDMYLRAVFRASVIQQIKEKENNLVQNMATSDAKWAAVRKEIVIYYLHNAWQALIWNKTCKGILWTKQKVPNGKHQSLYSVRASKATRVSAQGFRVKLSIPCKTNCLQPPQLNDNNNLVLLFFRLWKLRCFRAFSLSSKGSRDSLIVST